MSSIETKHYLTPEELAEVWRVHVGSVYRWLRNGTIPFVVRGGSKWIPEYVVMQGTKAEGES
jgi:excisionase family DNA binding protein